MIKNIKMLLLVSLTFVACSKSVDDEIVDAPLTAGTANFSKYVALGNSLTAGFADGTLYKKGQEGAYTTLMAEQFKLVGGGEFKVPFMLDNIGGFANGATQVPGFPTRLFFNGAGPASVPGVSGTQITAKLVGQYNNMGVPGAKSFHLLAPGYGNLAGVFANPPTANPYFARFSSSATASIISDAMAQAPTFFSLWIGNNDVLGYATTGGDGSNPITPLAGPAGVGFEATYTALVNALTANQAKGVLGNIPDVSALPFFTTVPTNAIPPLPAANAAQLNQLFAGINSALEANSLPARFATLSTTTANPLLIRDKALPNIAAAITAALTPQLGAPTATFLGSIYGQARHAVNTASGRDFVLLTTRTIIGTPQAGAPSPFNTVGVSFPLQDSAVLSVGEALEIKNATTAYNNVIKGLATTKNLAFVDANATLNQVNTSGGINFGNFNLTSQFITGGAFSMDGVHLSPRGYALIANKFLEAINLTYGSNFKPYDLAKFNIQFPAVIQ
jgi:hypothetical protein